MTITTAQIKRSLDVALLKPTATNAEIESLAEVLRSEAFSFMCVSSFHAAAAARALGGSDVTVVACVGFPHGTVTTDTRVFEAAGAIADGAGEIDMVLNLGAFLGATGPARRRTSALSSARPRAVRSGSSSRAPS